MIVKLTRPDPPIGPWRLQSRYVYASFIRPTPELARMMETVSGYFYAEPTEDGWRISGRAPDQVW
jgi:hypothetical protein